MFDFTVKVLVVDDFPVMRSIIKNLLWQIGFENVEEAEDSLQALDKIKNGDYGLIVSDWHMPIMEGIELLKNIRNDPKLKELPFLMVTSDAKKEKIINAIKVGADSYIVKPFTAERLKETLARIAEKHLSLRLTE